MQLACILNQSLNDTNALGDYAATWIYDVSVIMGVRLCQNIT